MISFKSAEIRITPFPASRCSMIFFQKNVPDEIKKTIEEKKQEVLDGKIEIPTALGDADQNEVQALIDSVAP